MKLKIKYCGGCNPSINRKRVVDEVIDRLKRQTKVEITREQADVVLVVGGCSVCCVDIGDVRPDQTVMVGGHSVDCYQVKPAELAATIVEKVLRKEVDLGVRLDEAL